MTSTKMLPIFIVLLLQISDTTGSECSDAAEKNNIPYIRMCEDGSVTSDKVILDTHSAGATGETTCSCTFNATLIAIIYVQHYGNGLNPNTSGCGSEVVVNETTSHGKKRIRSFTCNTFPEVLIYELSMTIITWRGGPGGDSKYCLNITGSLIIPNTTFTITCSKPATPTTLDPPTTTTSTTITTTTTTQGDVTHYEPITDVDKNTNCVTRTTSTAETSVTSTKTSDFPYSGEEEGSIFLPVPAFAAIIVLLCLIMLYATIITLLYVRRYFTLEKQPRSDNTNGTTTNIQTDEGYVNMPIPSSSDGTYEGLELSHVDLSTNTYEVLGNSGT